LITERSGGLLSSVTEDTMSKPQDLVQGTLDLLLLKILALEPMKGHAISQRLRQVSGDVLQVSDGSLYPAPHARTARLANGAMENHGEQPAREILRAQPAGASASGSQAENWSRLSTAITHVVNLERA
jgi:PadR family transcriptional regulator